MEILANNHQFTVISEKELETVAGGVVPVVAIPVGVKIGGYIVGGLSAVGLIAWGYFR